MKQSERFYELLEEIFEGTTKKIKIKRWEKSTTTEPSKCSKCNGSGEVRYVQKSMLGQVVNVQICSACNGIGYTGGREQKTATIKVKIPSGTQSGKRFRLKGKGMPLMRGSGYGDLYIQIITEVPISLTSEQKELLEKFRILENNKSNPTIKRFFEKAKSFWKN